MFSKYGPRCLWGVIILCRPVTSTMFPFPDQVNVVQKSVLRTSEWFAWNTSDTIWPIGRPCWQTKLITLESISVTSFQFNFSHFYCKIAKEKPPNPFQHYQRVFPFVKRNKPFWKKLGEYMWAEYQAKSQRRSISCHSVCLRNGVRDENLDRTQMIPL
jgi:hypothetical protein